MTSSRKRITPLFFVVLSLLLAWTQAPSAQANIPLSIHQIWIGDEVPRYLNMVSRSFSSNDNWEYSLWRTTVEALSEENGKIERQVWSNGQYQSTHHYPVSELLKNEHDVLKKIIHHNQKSPDNHLASVSDIIRYRLIHDFGGFYFDMKFELLNPSRLAHLASNSNLSLITANEFQFSPGDLFYLSNGFFGAVPKHQALSSMLNDLKKDRHSITSKGVDIFGPAYFLTHISQWNQTQDNDESWRMLPHNEIYPYVDWAPRAHKTGQRLRKPATDPCLWDKSSSHRIPQSTAKKLRFLKLSNNRGVYFKYPCKVTSPNTIAIDHFDYGSSWNSHNRLEGLHR